MVNIIKNAYEDAVLEMKKVLPEKIQRDFKANKQKLVAVVLLLLSVELLIISGLYDVIFGS